MSNKNKIYKLISGVLVNTMVLGISNQVFENLKVFASSGVLDEDYIPEENLVEIDEDYIPEENLVEVDEDYYNAEELNEKNIDENGLKYELNGEEATVEKCTDKEIERITIPSYVEKDGKVYKVTKIGSFAFEDCSGLTGELKIPGSVTSINGYAFKGCSGLTEVEIPSGVTKIGSYAFADCSGLTGELKIPDSVTFIGVGAFARCSGLTGELKIPESVTYIDRYAFYGCSSLTGELKIPDSVTSIGDYAFEGCSGLTSVKIPGSVERIGRCAFKLCKNVTIESDIVHQADDGLIYVLNKKDKTAQLNSVLNIEIEKANILANVKKDGKVYTVTEIGANAFAYWNEAENNGKTLPQSITFYIPSSVNKDVYQTKIAQGTKEKSWPANWSSTTIQE